MLRPEPNCRCLETQSDSSDPGPPRTRSRAGSPRLSKQQWKCVHHKSAIQRTHRPSTHRNRARRHILAADRQGAARLRVVSNPESRSCEIQPGCALWQYLNVRRSRRPGSNLHWSSVIKIRNVTEVRCTEVRSQVAIKAGAAAPKILFINRKVHGFGKYFVGSGRQEAQNVGTARLRYGRNPRVILINSDDVRRKPQKLHSSGSRGSARPRTEHRQRDRSRRRPQCRRT